MLLDRLSTPAQPPPTLILQITKIEETIEHLANSIQSIQSQISAIPEILDARLSTHLSDFKQSFMSEYAQSRELERDAIITEMRAVSAVRPQRIILPQPQASEVSHEEGDSGGNLFVDWTRYVLGLEIVGAWP